MISGTGALTKTAAGTVILSNANSYGGGTTISQGTLQLGDGSANNGSVSGNITDNATLAFANPNVQTYSGVISGNGAVTKSGAGTLTLSGVSSYGATTVNAGQLTIGNNLINSGTLAVAGGTISQSSYAVNAGQRGRRQPWQWLLPPKRRNKYRQRRRVSVHRRCQRFAGLDGHLYAQRRIEFR